MAVVSLMQTFVRLTGWLPQRIVFRTKVLYEDRNAQGSRIHGPAILVSNHTAIYDFAAMLFVFYSRTLRYQMAEVLFRKKLLLHLRRKHLKATHLTLWKNLLMNLKRMMHLLQVLLQTNLRQTVTGATSASNRQAMLLMQTA